MTRTVFAVDVTTSVVSIARVQETDGPAIPAVSWIDPPSFGGSHRPLTTWQKACEVADEVVAKITSAGNPTMVVMAKQQWGPTAPWKLRGNSRASLPGDPSAQRRIQIHTLIEDRLHRLGVPVAEFPYVTALKWARGYGEKGRGGEVMTALTDYVASTWGIEQRTEIGRDGKPHTRSFRPAVAVLAAIGAMAVGVEVAGIEVTDARLGMLDAAKNAMIQWPAEFVPPSTPASWDERRRHPEVLTVGV
ncbi:hypothetical protein [Mycolicibacterium brumae]|uniref:DUF429 domain-containing protein n=1 Tax=Mycolicibacterium brumae TaxID=85968 RepID=A0A2G5P7U2_9MYCO|nr:hypothetical protein [Mycolicibacterium brumae]MCV7194125.1 hypothetical protein [Mycolicibacterium brumae]PIB74439.1 hypothetical protein CQY22_013300 [Mycolicibacterium brumae]RWA22703.1 hypothetical protein MBRU_12195 [Mycolicibacterium brumae DSM 44177]UWW07492.1 hypothetical protein L2Z93_000507 [Mycolicibacterium brumae]